MLEDGFFGAEHDREATKQLGLQGEHTIFLMGREVDYTGDIRDVIEDFADAGLCTAKEVIDAAEERIAHVQLPTGFALVGLRPVGADKPLAYGVVDFRKFGEAPEVQIASDATADRNEDLQKRIQDLEAKVRRLESDLEQARVSHTASAVGRLRLREVCMLYVGDQPLDTVIGRVRTDLGADAAEGIERHLFDLNRAPLPHSQLEAIKRAFNHGLARW